MTDRHNPGSAVLPAPGSPPGLALPRSTLWQKFFGDASPTRQRELLDLARHQGVLYTHQVPANGSHAAPADRGRQLLASLLDAADKLEPLTPVAVDLIDAALDEHQRDAVARGLTTPDVCLIQGLPGTGKTRVVAELIQQASRKGERILLSAASAAALDGVLTQVAHLDSVFAVRGLDVGERPEALAKPIRALTADCRLRWLRDDGLAGLRRDAAALQETIRKADQQQAALESCAALLQRLEDHQARLDQLRSATPPDLPALAAATQARDQAQARCDAALADIDKRAADARQRLEQVDAERAPLQALADARQSGRWWTGAWWQARFASGALARLDALTADRQRIDSEAAELTDQQHRLRQELAEAESTYQAKRRACLEVEIAAAVAAAQEARAQWQALTAIAPERAALQEAIASCQRDRQQQTDRAAFASEWIDCLSRQGDALPGWLAASVNLAAVPIAALASDPHFGETALPGLPFDLAIVEEAQRMTEADFARLARRARRLVLVADLEPDHAPRSERTPPTPTVFQRLWQRLHSDPRRLPYSWQTEQGRLCCRLRACPAEQRRYLESERLADFPDIELRILTLPRAAPTLAEVVFPASMSIGQAKEYIFRELQELPVHSRGHSFRWHEETDRLQLRLADTPLEAPAPVALAGGVREMIGPGGHTCCIEFDRQAGWDRSRAEAWIGQHLGVRDLGRTMRLDHPYRMGRDLACVVSDILYAGGYRLPAHEANGTGAVVEFVAVPPAEKPAGRKAAHPPRRGGAGLELDLADARQRSRLPEEVRAGLPAVGVVNYFEAQAVIRKLEALARSGQTNMGVLALYPAQADLIRALAAGSKALAGLDVPIGSPENFCQRENAVMLVSLTRSHTNRAVPYGDSPGQLAMALTRARCRLIVFGDPGTLVRRGQWDKAVDHLDETMAAREREVIGRLCEYLQGKGTHARAFHLDEGIGP